MREFKNLFLRLFDTPFLCMNKYNEEAIRPDISRLCARTFVSLTDIDTSYYTYVHIKSLLIYFSILSN